MWPFSTTPSWSTLAQEKVSVRNSIIKEESVRCRYDDDVTYLHATASEIVKRIEKGEWTAVDVLESYIGRAVKAQEKTNCLTEILFEDARKQAKALDEEFARTGNLKGPLHGVPISFKDCFDIVGYDTTMGFTGGINKPAKTNADILTVTKSLGAIPLAKTNLPQTMMFFECTNPIWGRTLNPFSEHHTSGGSSGEFPHRGVVFIRLNLGGGESVLLERE
ncbi:Amidase signature (AS) superfamily protein, partial [Abortiporus biennis]